jgi:hypothetical protein
MECASRQVQKFIEPAHMPRVPLAHFKRRIASLFFFFFLTFCDAANIADMVAQGAQDPNASTTQTPSCAACCIHNATVCWQLSMLLLHNRLYAMPTAANQHRRPSVWCHCYIAALFFDGCIPRGQ